MGKLGRQFYDGERVRRPETPAKLGTVIGQSYGGIYGGTFIHVVWDDEVLKRDRINFERVKISQSIVRLVKIGAITKEEMLTHWHAGIRGLVTKKYGAE